MVDIEDLDDSEVSEHEENVEERELASCDVFSNSRMTCGFLNFLMSFLLFNSINRSSF
jgi:hypothetical protein